MPHTHDVVVSGGTVRKTYVSWAQREPEREWAALVHLHREVPGLAPAPLARETERGRPVVVMSRVPGEPLTGRLSARQTAGLVDALAALFALPVPDGLDARANDPITFAPRFGAWLVDDYAWQECQEPALVRDAVGRALGWLVDRPPEQDWLLDPVVALGDGNLDNVLWDGERCRLIDWEEYGVSDLAYEVADVVEHASSRLAGALDVDGLLDGLGLSAPQRRRLRHHRTFFACFWLAMLLPGNGGWRRNPPGSTEAQARHLLALLGDADPTR